MSSNLLSDLRAKANELEEADRLYREAFPGYEPDPKDSPIPFATLLHDAANALEPYWLSVEQWPVLEITDVRVELDEQWVWVIEFRRIAI